MRGTLEGAPEGISFDRSEEDFSEEDLAKLDDLTRDEEEQPSAEGKPFPGMREDIPSYLYNEGTKMYDAAWLYVMEGIKDVKKSKRRLDFPYSRFII